jgi:hypothetical protein
MKAQPSGTESPLLCPSSSPDSQESMVIGVIGGTGEQPHMRHLEQPVPVTEEILALTGPVTPTEVFRFASPCLCSSCANFADSRCSLATRIVRLLPVATETLPPCRIRSRCRWWHEEGREACLRCPQVVTDNYSPSDLMRLASEPATPATAEPADMTATRTG